MPPSRYSSHKHPVFTVCLGKSKVPFSTIITIWYQVNRVGRDHPGGTITYEDDVAASGEALSTLSQL